MAPASFLGLPIEIRMRIYLFVSLSNAIWYQEPSFSAEVRYRECVTRVAAPEADPGTQETPVAEAGSSEQEAGTGTQNATAAEAAEAGSSEQEADTGTQDATAAEVGSPEEEDSPEEEEEEEERPPLMCRIPSSLLRTCRQVYHESRCIPYHKNDFIFVDYFGPGLRTAIWLFDTTLTAWQTAECRYISLDVHGEAIGQEDRRRADWIALCKSWKGLRELRLTVIMDGHTAESGSDADGDEQPQEKKKKKLENAWELVRERTEWISQGLSRLGKLQRLEVVVVDQSLAEEGEYDVRWGDLVRWCQVLQKVLHTSSGRMVAVVPMRTGTRGY